MKLFGMLRSSVVVYILSVCMHWVWMAKIPMKIQQRDIFLVPFPFSDLSQTKVRPVLILSKDTFNNSSQDVIVCSITSNIAKNPYKILIDNEKQI